MADKDIDLLALLEKAAESMDDPDTATTDELLSAFFQNLESVIGEQVAVAKGAGPFVKARLTSMNDVLDTVNKMSDADLNQWLRVTRPTDAKVYDGSKAKAFDASTKPGDPDGGIQSGDPATGDPTKNWNPSASGKVPGSSTGKELKGKTEFAGGAPSSSSAFPGMAKSLGDFLDSMADATPEEIDRAKTGLSQLDPDIVSTLDKAVSESGKLMQSLDAEIDPEVEAVLRRGELLSERELRKSIIINSAHLLERVAKLRDVALAKQVELTGDPDDTFEAEARQGRVR